MNMEKLKKALNELTEEELMDRLGSKQEFYLAELAILIDETMTRFIANNGHITENSVDAYVSSFVELLMVCDKINEQDIKNAKLN